MVCFQALLYACLGEFSLRWFEAMYLWLSSGATGCSSHGIMVCQRLLIVGFQDMLQAVGGAFQHSHLFAYADQACAIQLISKWCIR